MTSPLLALTADEWENLCDGCGRCCLVKLEDEDTGEIHYTNVACRFLDTASCRCTDYENRERIQPACIVLGPERLDTLEQMPWTCAYRLVHEGRTLDRDPESLPVTGKVVSEQFIHEEQVVEHLADWVSNSEPARKG